MSVKKPRPTTEAEDRSGDDSKLRNPAAGEPIQDEDMLVDPLIKQINSGDDAKDPPPST
jgi:hypothetical protein